MSARVDPSLLRTSETADGELLEWSGTEGNRIVGEAFGSPEAQPVIFLHGGGQTRGAWGGAARSLAERGYRGITVDLRGHGDSDWSPSGDYLLNAFVGDLHRILEAQPMPPVVVGASLGGMTALLAEGESDPSVLRALVLVDVAHRMDRGGVTRVIQFMKAAPDGFASLEEAADAVSAYLPHRERPRDLSGLHRNLRKHPDGRLRWHWDPQFLGPKPAAESETVPLRLHAAAAALRIPTLLVRGQLSDVLREEQAQEFLALAKTARMVEVGRAAHMVAGDKNDVFNTAIVDFLEHALR